MMESIVEPTFADVQAAAGRLRGVAHRTPVLRSHSFDEAVGATVVFKCENFQRAGAFKFRGAYNAISRLGPAERARGVLAYSSGNHAQAIALSGSLLGVATTIVMPRNAPAVKLAATRGYGAEVVLYDPLTEVREEVGARIAGERGSNIIPPYDHPDVVAGAGTAALELLEEVGPLDVILTPCGGGGLLSGTAITAAAQAPGCRVIGVEPERADDATRSFRTGTLHRVHNPDTIADGVRTPSLGRITFPLVLRLVADMATVSEEAILRAMFFLWERMKIVVEPTGALGAAALLDGAVRLPGQRVGVIVSGGNVDIAGVGALFARVGG